MKTIKIIDSNIKGYHIYHIRPCTKVVMHVEPEFGNSYDPNAMLVKIPELKELLTMTEEETMKSKAGKIVGRVPANLGQLFRHLLSNGKVKNIECWATDEPTISKVPRASQSFKRNFKGLNRRGGGAVIPCQFILKCYDSSYDSASEFLTENLRAFKHGTEKVVLEKSSASCPF